mmetsp:Transcript_2100/g.7602  ORF Transcript_2100/g.7602 Transcript_2100/m.7602 type:complete len:438 (+) Transcript_2100:2404-3717(+)
MSLKPYRLLLKNIHELVTVSGNKEPFLTGKQMNEPLILTGAWNVSVDNNGRIAKIWKAHHNDLHTSNPLLNESNYDQIIDCTGKAVIPGLVDAHTHPVWTGDRTDEFALKLAGASYLDIHNKGGGIGFTVRHVRDAHLHTLKTLFKQRIRTMSANGTTLLEAKSGYGLDCDNEIKMLRVIHQVKQDESDTIDVVGTWLGAHSYPKDISREDYDHDLLNNQIPTIAKLINQGEISPEMADVFLEKNVFDREMTRKILVKAKEVAGLAANFHGDELNYMASGELSGEINARSVSHLEHVSEDGIKAMAEHKVCAVLLPTTAYVLRIEYPPARKLIEGGVPVCIASDYNPNAHCMSMPFVMNLSCVNMRLTMNEALVASTLNAAASLGKSESHGSIEEGKCGDFVIVGNEDWRHIIYELVNPPIKHVIKNGRTVFTNSQL